MNILSGKLSQSHTHNHNEKKNISHQIQTNEQIVSSDIISIEL